MLLSGEPPPKKSTVLREGAECIRGKTPLEAGEACIALGTVMKARAGGEAFITSRRIGAPQTYFDVALNADVLLEGGLRK